MADQLYRVKWKAGAITVHASSQERAIEVALEYLRVPDAKRLNVELAREVDLEAAATASAGAGI